MGRKRKRESNEVQSTVIQSSSSPSSLPCLKKLKWGSDRYSSSQFILLVGEGDFSFSLSLANTFGSANNIVATSKDSQDDVQAKFGQAKQNLEDLQKMGAQILHEVDATAMDEHNELKFYRFDRIIFNFPHAGFMGKEDLKEVINLHRQLVLGFFKTAANMLKPNGEIHVSHKIGDPYDKWELEELASRCSLRLIERSEFISSDYPGYANKRGAGKAPDLAFNLGSCCTFKFKIYDARQELDRLRKSLNPVRPQESTAIELKPNGESVPNSADRLFTIPRGYRSLIEPSFTQIGAYVNPLLFNRQRMLGMRDHGFCSTAEYSNGKIIIDVDEFFAMRRTCCISPRVRQNYIQRGGHGISLLSSINMSSLGSIFPRAPRGERDHQSDEM